MNRKNFIKLHSATREEAQHDSLRNYGLKMFKKIMQLVDVDPGELDDTFNITDHCLQNAFPFVIYPIKIKKLDLIKCFKSLPNTEAWKQLFNFAEETPHIAVAVMFKSNVAGYGDWVLHTYWKLNNSPGECRLIRPASKLPNAGVILERVESFVEATRVFWES